MYPKNNQVRKKNISINHGNTAVSRAVETLIEFDDFYDYANLFAKDLKEIKGIKSPDDLRKRILLKFAHPLSILKPIEKKLGSLFSTVLSNDIKDFAALLEMCRKAEELDIDYDLKEKVRVEISDIILNQK